MADSVKNNIVKNAPYFVLVKMYQTRCIAGDGERHAHIQPADGYRIGIEELRTSRSLTFSWLPVSGANAYILTLYRQTSGGRQQVNRIGPQTGVSWILDDIAVLERGAYIWQVEAVSRNQAGVIVLGGTVGENTFVLDVPSPGAPQVVDTGRLYGE